MAVAAAKGELFATAQAGDVCVVNADDPLVMALPVPPGVRMVNHQIFCNPQKLAGILPTSPRIACEIVSAFIPFL
jgi:hypothetical protein